MVDLAMASDVDGDMEDRDLALPLAPQGRVQRRGCKTVTRGVKTSSLPEVMLANGVGPGSKGRWAVLGIDWYPVDSCVLLQMRLPRGCSPRKISSPGPLST